MKKRWTKWLSAAVAAAMLLSAIPVFAAGNDDALIIAEIKTDTPAQIVYNMEGYASVVIENYPMSEQEKQAEKEKLEQEWKSFNNDIPEGHKVTFNEFLEIFFDVADLTEYYSYLENDYCMLGVAAPDGKLVRPLIRAEGNHETAEIYQISDGVIFRNHTNYVSSVSDPNNGYFDLNGNRVIKEDYRCGKPFSNGLAFVRTYRRIPGETEFDSEPEIRAYLIDHTGKIVLDLSETFALPNGGYGDGPAGEFWYFETHAGLFSEGLMPFSSTLYFGDNVLAATDVYIYIGGLLAGYFDLEGNVVIPQKYGAVYPFSDGLAAVQEATIETVYFYFDDNGDRVYVSDPSEAPDPNDVLDDTEVKKGKYGYIDKNDNVVIPFIYDAAESFCGDYAIVKKDGKYGIINRSNETVVEFSDEQIWSVENGMYFAVTDSGAQLRNLASNKVIWSISSEKYEDISAYVNGMIYYTKDGVLSAVSIDEKHTAGDIDGDETVTAADARLALRAAVQLEHYLDGSAVFLAADTDGSGSVTAADARAILRAAVGLEELPG